MTPVLKALVTAQRAGFDAPKCVTCHGSGRTKGPVLDWSCEACCATGLDASNPEMLSGRAMLHLFKRNHVIFHHEVDPMFPSQVYWGPKDWPIDSARCDMSTEGLAIALLELVSRRELYYK